MKPPKSLNSYPVRDYTPRDGTADSYLVLVERVGNSIHPWVVATWHPTLRCYWVWGHYFKTRREARVYMNEQRAA